MSSAIRAISAENDDFAKGTPVDHDITNELFLPQQLTWMSFATSHLSVCTCRDSLDLAAAAAAYDSFTQNICHFLHGGLHPAVWLCAVYIQRFEAFNIWKS